MNKLEVGMWVRTKYGINKIDRTFYTVSGVNHNYIDLENCYIDDEYNLRQGISIENIIKASFNIIDLIELGDIVELFMEDDIDCEDTDVFELVGITCDKKELGVLNSDFQIEFFPIENLRGIVTKEQFEQMKYEVE